MQGQWKPNGDDTPAHLGRMWSKGRTRAGSARTVAIAAGVVAVVLVVAVIIAITSSGDKDSPAAGGAPDTSTHPAPSGSEAPKTRPPTTYPETGDYHVQVLHSGYCLGVAEQEGHDRHALMQMACAEAKPKMTFEATAATGVFQVKLHYPEDDWIACLTLDDDQAGYLYGPQSCEDPLLHDFTLEPVAENVYRVKSPGGLCMDAVDGEATPKTLFAAAECSPTSASQQFRFDKQ